MSIELGATLKGLINLLGEVRNSVGEEERQLIDKTIAEVVFQEEVEVTASIKEAVVTREVIEKILLEVGAVIDIPNGDTVIRGFAKRPKQRYLSTKEYVIYRSSLERLIQEKEVREIEIDGIKVYYEVAEPEEDVVVMALQYFVKDEEGIYVTELNWTFGELVSL